MKNVFRLLVFLLPLVSGCSKHQNPKPAPVIPKPSAALLSQPAQNAACTTGTAAGNNQSVVSFSWNAADHATSYKLVVTNLNNNSMTTRMSTVATATATLQEATPYAWYIISLSSATTDTVHSATWKFYNAGPGQTNFAPFPATLLLPAYDQTVAAGTVNLSWSGDAVQNNITGYDLYFGTTASPVLYKSGISASPLAVTVSAGTTYYWQVITHDGNGNSSSSQVWTFDAK